jgi:hypothetical protein
MKAFTKAHIARLVVAAVLGSLADGAANNVRAGTRAESALKVIVSGRAGSAKNGNPF